MARIKENVAREGEEKKGKGRRKERKIEMESRAERRIPLYQWFYLH